MSRLILILVMIVLLSIGTLVHYGYIDVNSPYGMIKLGFLLLTLGGLLTYAKKLEDISYAGTKFVLYMLAVILILIGFWNMVGKQFHLFEPLNPIDILKKLIQWVVP